MHKLFNKTSATATALFAALSLSAPAAADHHEEDEKLRTAPATEHQAETLKGVDDEANMAFTNSKPKAVGEKEQLNDDQQPPATVHQEEAIKAYPS